MLHKLNRTAVISNEQLGDYRPKFFELEEFGISEVVFESVFFDDEEKSVEEEILKGEYSLAYLREDKLRSLTAYDKEGVKINNILTSLRLEVKGANVFKAGKYLSRVFRPVKYGEFLTGVDVKLNSNYELSLVDGISLISVELAKMLGWNEAKPGMSAQFTLLGKNGLTKGHCVVSDRIKSDIVIYGEENIKSEIALSLDAYYISVEPLKLGKSLRLDIQSMLNLWGMLGDYNLINWAKTSIDKFKTDLLEGKLSEWLDDFDKITPRDYDKETWVLKKAIWRKIDYRRFPGLFRMAWAMFRNSMESYTKRSGAINYRIPVIGGKRAYVRVDLREHDSEGNFSPLVKRGFVDIDKYGNLWMHPEDIARDLKILGGADQDDNLAIIPIKGNKALIYRSPNQYGEFIIKDVENNKIEYDINIDAIKQKDTSLKRETEGVNESEYDNPFLKLIKDDNINGFERQEGFSARSLIRAYMRIKDNHGSIGVAANAEMIRSSVAIEDKEVFDYLFENYSWDLEKIIDSTVKDGVSADKEKHTIDAMYNEISDLGIELPDVLKERLPKSVKEKVCFSCSGKLSKLFEAVKILIDKSDVQIIGRGINGNRTQGLIDSIDTPFVEIGLQNIDNPMQDIALDILANYNRDISINMKISNTEERKEKIQNSKSKLLAVLSRFSKEERILINRAWAYHIYKSDKSVHDSILWIKDIEGKRGTAEDSFDMLSYLKQATAIKRNGTIERHLQEKALTIEDNSVRLWTKEIRNITELENAQEMIVEQSKALIGDTMMNIGDEHSLSDGVYRIKAIARARSKRDASRYLKNSITVWLG